MRIGVTIKFQNSYFSGSTPQVACALARSFAMGGHEVALLYPQGETNWFVDMARYGKELPPCVAFSSEAVSAQPYDVIVEVMWQLVPSDRVRAAKRVIGLYHYPPLFHDIESSLYSNWNPARRNFKNLSTIWTYSFYSKQDVRYLEFLSGVPVQQIPYVWDPTPLDMFVEDEHIPEWSDSARRVEQMLPSGAPATLTWCARILESNFSNSSSCVLPLNIVSEIRKKADPIRFSVHNGEATGKHPFFQQNIARNLLLPDISGNMVPRVRLPDLRREKSFFIAHQRHRPLKAFMLDATYLGIPLIHNCEIIRNVGGTYYYELNQISQAVDAWRKMKSDSETKEGFFHPRAAEVRKQMLRAKFSPEALKNEFNTLLTTTPSPSKSVAPLMAPITSIPSMTTQQKELRVAFCHMWDNFMPQHNFFMYLLSWIGSFNNIKVYHDPVTPNLVFCSPLGNGDEVKYPGVPKVHFTGENKPKKTGNDIFLNIGFNYDTSDDYVRLPLWVLYLNWFGAQNSKVVNPVLVNVEDALRVDSKVLDSKQKFCAFVVSNPCNPMRNTAFHVLNQWRGVDSGGHLFNNLPSGPLPSGCGGGGGGELDKVEFFKNYKFVIAFENSSSPGYTTEKLFHAKLSGAVPIYWGDPFVDRDFDSRGFLNANQVKSPQELVEMVQKVADDPEKWRAMASVPALSEFKLRWCQMTMEDVARRIFKQIIGAETKIPLGAWKTAVSHGAKYEEATATAATAKPSMPITLTSMPSLATTNILPTKRTFITAANEKYLEAAVNALSSFNNYDPECKKIVYLWPSVNPKIYEILQKQGATEIRILPTDAATETPWSDYWDPQHFAWKLWVLKNAYDEAAADESVLYLDAGTMIAGTLHKIWNVIDTQGVFLLDDDEQTNERWCHPAFCKNMSTTQQELVANQIWAGGLGFKKGNACIEKVFKEALEAAKTRETIVGDKWRPYSATCLGHRHDQSILSVLTQRAASQLPRQSLKEYYCDTSLRAAEQFTTPLYVHRGNFVPFASFTKGIDEVYLINLARRSDRLTRFKHSHSSLKKSTYVLPAVDGKTLQITPELVHCFRDNDFHWKKAVMGCAISHLTLWEKLANDKVASSYLILEDDVKMPSSWLSEWKRMAENIPADTDVIYLGGVLPPNKPALPLVTERVNADFARVKKNNLYGGQERRYFHFCNYAYVLTKSGAQKLVKLVKERGIFTSGDHMIVNHGDSLLNIYFTTPMLAGCFQEDDPKYVNSKFNDFSRIDGFDSDLWNNDERFTQEEIMKTLSASITPDYVSMTPSTSQTTSSSQPLTYTNDQITTIWNRFLKAIALKQGDDVVRAAIDDIFSSWSTMSKETFVEKMSYFRIFEQLVVTQNSELMKHKDEILAKSKDMAQRAGVTGATSVWEKILGSLAPTATTAATTKSLIAYHMQEITPTFMECQWLDALFPQPLTYKSFNNVQTLLEAEGVPLIVYQKLPNSTIDVKELFKTIVSIFEERGKQLSLLHLSDEFGNDSIEIYGSKAVKQVYRNYWRPDLNVYGQKVMVLPLGYANDRCATQPSTPSFNDRKQVWSFAGSLDRPGRREGLAALRVLEPHEEKTKNIWSPSEGLSAKEYNEILRDTKFVPCFRGSCALESFRFYEALEHGAIPLYVSGESAHGSKDEYYGLFGGMHPFLALPSWDVATKMLPSLLAKPEVMEKHRAQIQEWWQAKKKSLKAQIQQTL